LLNHYLFKTIFLTGLALIAFAANSILCRLALGNAAIDASSFTIIRLLSGTIVLQAIIRSTRNTDHVPNKKSVKGSWVASLMLFIYATAFSYAYISLDTGTGALILFGTVQITMILQSIFSGTRLHWSEWAGVAMAFLGFIYLVLPGVTTPSITGFMLMAAAGIAWGVYTLIGRHSKSPLMDTADNFLRTTPFVLLLALFTLHDISYSPEGILLAFISGGLASGIGYAIWYLSLSALSTTQAAVLQLSVPLIAALGGVIFVSEAITIRLTFSAAFVLGGILLVILGKYYSRKTTIK